MNPLQQLLQALMSVGQGTPQSAEAIQREHVADASLNQQGSLMGSQRQQQLTGDQDPLLATLAKLMNVANPIEWMGGMAGGSGAVLGPIRNQAQKRIVSSLAKNSPDLLDTIKKLPERVSFDSRPIWNNPTASGSMEGGIAIPDKWITINPQVMKGRLPQAAQQAYPEMAGLTGKDTMFANLPAVIGHEAQHAVNKPLLSGMQPSSHEQFAMRIIEALKGREGGEQIMQNLSGLGSPASRAYQGADEALAYLRQHQVAKNPIGDYGTDALNASLISALGQ